MGVEKREREQDSPVMSMAESAAEGYKMIQSLMETDRAELFGVAPHPRSHQGNSVSKQEWDSMVEDFKRNQALKNSSFNTSSEGARGNNDTVLNNASQDPPSTIQRRYPQCASSSSSDVIFLFVDPRRPKQDSKPTTSSK